MTAFYDQLFIFRAIGALVIAGVTLLLCRYGGRAEIEEGVIEEEFDEWERYETEDTGRAYYERREDWNEWE